MKIGISSWAYPWAVGVPGSAPDHPLTALDLVDRAAELGVDIVQIADNVPLHEQTEAELDALAIRAKKRHVEIEVGTLGLAPDHLRRYLRIAERLGSRIVRVVIDTPTHHPEHDEIVRTLREVMVDFAQSRVHLLIENHDRFRAVTLRSLLEEVDNPWLGVCLDTVNSLGCLEVAETVFDVLHPWVRNVHLKDFSIGRIENRMGFTVTGTPAGQGHLDVRQLLAAVHALPHEATVILELWPSAEPTLDATIAKERAWAEASVEYMRRCVEELA